MNRSFMMAMWYMIVHSALEASIARHVIVAFIGVGIEA